MFTICENEMRYYDENVKCAKHFCFVKQDEIHDIKRLINKVDLLFTETNGPRDKYEVKQQQQQNQCDMAFKVFEYIVRTVFSKVLYEIEIRFACKTTLNCVNRLCTNKKQTEIKTKNRFMTDRIHLQILRDILKYDWIIQRINFS